MACSGSLQNHLCGNNPVPALCGCRGQVHNGIPNCWTVLARGIIDGNETLTRKFFNDRLHDKSDKAFYVHENPVILRYTILNESTNTQRRGRV